jgi:hypothetical protein
VIVEELVLTCAECKQPMACVERACSRPPKDDHPHMRCERCSPPDFAVCVRMKARLVVGEAAGGEPW